MQDLTCNRDNVGHCYFEKFKNLQNNQFLLGGKQRYTLMTISSSRITGPDPCRADDKCE